MERSSAYGRFWANDINFMEVQDNQDITAIQILHHWVYVIQYLLWVVHDIELYVNLIDYELTVVNIHLTL